MFKKLLNKLLGVKLYKWKGINHKQIVVYGKVKFSGRYDKVAIIKQICDEYQEEFDEPLLIVEIIGD